ncbi:TonB-dependent siderophore receptor [Pseudomonas fluorescens]|uniref:TonB-dependent siderophore receptor n=1 Tax=Pseudomonas fluorescens TaxID=294 RepID=A0A944DJJ3_PSEFL|nr:TonB-dependent siderophore receptor [Pseudomonas fluorescens]MBT2311938.1 TonB-dependent siderophore receptor [Pseudomonas fluorescens]MBT2316889.1 TonB-dependent siderophore receptor [Pseudomonas fluorescens]MBT2330022.1 TonB-dependent siderophore receptor [Pseudomonas fluorescens]MBT2344708.1 TonB-dependent siderophore receptor [Pseudomonas fluorescens]MBT2347902.1 TonB-dependent siderophore receptor [Pseudomonas fluorescens]
MSSSPVPQRHRLNRALHGAVFGVIVSSYALPSLAQTSSVDQAHQVHSWNIPAGPLAPALDRFAREAGISLSFDASSVANRNTQGVSGTLDTPEALSSLLQGSDIAIQQQGPNAYLLTPQTSADGELDTFRLAPILVNAKARVDGTEDANSVVAQELWVGGKVATSILNTPASVSVVTDKEMKQRSVSTTEELLQYTPGVLTDYYGTDDRNDYFQIRGFQATTYRDGLTLGSMRGVREEPFAYERVEVIRGANSTLFGPADPGGSVNFVSKKPRFDTFGQGYVTYGSFDHVETGIDVGDSLNEDKTLAGRFTAKMQDSEREYNHSQDDNKFLMGGLTWAPTDFTSASVIVDYLKTQSSPNSGGYPLDKEYDRDKFYGEPSYNFHDVERTNISGTFSHDFDNGFVVRSNLRYSELNDDFGYVFLSDSPTRTGTTVPRYIFGTDSEAEQLNGNLMLQYDARFENIDSSTLVGVEYGDSSTEETSVYATTGSIDLANPVFTGVPSAVAPYSNNKLDTKTKAVFLQQNLSFYERFIVTAGVRNDSMDLSSTDINNVKESDNFSETSYRGALTYIVNDEVSTYVSMVESVSPPTVGVVPKTGTQYEVGVKYAPIGMDALFSAAVYDLTQENVSIAVVLPSGVIEQQTVGESRVRGLDLEAKAELTPNLSLVGGYSYMESEVLRGTLYDGSSLKGNEFATAPKHSASLWSYYSVPGTDVSVGLGARYVGAYYFDAANTGTSDGTTLFDAAFNYQLFKGTDLAINVSNLLDEQHVVGSGTANYYNPGREITAKLSYNW